MPRTARRSAGSIARTAASVARHHASGSCSDHKGCGRDTVSAATPCPATVPLIWELSPGNRPEQVREALARWRQRLPERV